MGPLSPKGKFLIPFNQNKFLIIVAWLCLNYKDNNTSKELNKSPVVEAVATQANADEKIIDLAGPESPR